LKKKPDITAKRRYYNHISPTILDKSNAPFGKYKLKSITVANIENLQKILSTKINPRRQQVYAASTRNEIIFVLRAIFNLGIKNSWCSKNPINDDDVQTDIKKTLQQHEPGRIFTDDELKKFWNLEELVSKPRLYLFTTLCYYTGGRPDAIIDIQVKHINFNENRISLKAMKKG